MPAALQIDVWSSARPPRAIHPVDGFAAIVRSDRVAARVRAVIDGGGWVVAATIADELVGYASVVRPVPIAWDGRTFARRWDRLDRVLELGAIEVARPHRGSGVGARMAAALGADPRLDAVVLFAIAVAHHWDLAWSSRPPFVHRAALDATLARAGLAPRATDDDEVAMHPANALYARVGARVPADARDAFVRSCRARGTT